MKRAFTAVLLSGSLAASIQAIYAQGTLADYVRAGALRQKYMDAAPNVPETPHWVDAAHFWYRKTAPGGHEFVMVETSTGEKRAPFDHEKLAAVLSRESGQKYPRATLPFGGPAGPSGGAGRGGPM